MLTILVICSAIFVFASGDPASLPKHILQTGRQLPSIGFGTRHIENDQEGFKAILSAIKNGYRMFDTGHIFDNKQALGLAIKQQIQQKLIDRKDVFVMWKIWNTGHCRKSISNYLSKDIADMDLDHLDAGIIHYPISLKMGDTDWPIYRNASPIPMYQEKDLGYLEAYRGLEGAYLLGLIGNIGVANVNVHQLKKIFEIAHVRPVILQVECHPFFRNENLINFAKSHNMTVMCASPVLSGFEQLGYGDPPVVLQVANKHKKSIYQVALRWGMQRGTIVLPSSTDRKHQRENIQSLNFELDDDDMKRINGIPEITRIVNLANIGEHPDFPFFRGADKE